jgi:hypothetical protein
MTETVSLVILSFGNFLLKKNKLRLNIPKSISILLTTYEKMLDDPNVPHKEFLSTYRSILAEIPGKIQS